MPDRETCVWIGEQTTRSTHRRCWRARISSRNLVYDLDNTIVRGLVQERTQRYVSSRGSDMPSKMNITLFRREHLRMET